MECGQRPPVLIDTSRPAEDSHQRDSRQRNICDFKLCYCGMRSETASINRHESSCGRLAPERTRVRERITIQPKEDY